MSAIRLARGYTGRDKIIKFEGLLPRPCRRPAGESRLGALTLGQPSSPGVPADFARHTLTCTFNDVDSVRQVFELYPRGNRLHYRRTGGGNMNCVPPLPDFLPGLRALCDEFGALLDYRRSDDRLSGRAGGRPGLLRRGAGPDVAWAKSSAAAMPVGAFGGRRE